MGGMMMDDEFGGAGFGGGGRGRGPRGGDAPKPDEGTQKPDATPPAAADGVPPPDEGQPEPAADTSAEGK
jgi:hypothetical protein